MPYQQPNDGILENGTEAGFKNLSQNGGLKFLSHRRFTILF